MKVQTNLKAGGYLQNAAAQTEYVANQTVGFVNKAQHEARNMFGTVTGTAKSVVDSVSGLFSQG
jgi:hypothetical protein